MVTENFTGFPQVLSVCNLNWIVLGKREQCRVPREGFRGFSPRNEHCLAELWFQGAVGCLTGLV